MNSKSNFGKNKKKNLFFSIGVILDNFVRFVCYIYVVPWSLNVESVFHFALQRSRGNREVSIHYISSVSTLSTLFVIVLDHRLDYAEMVVEQMTWTTKLMRTEFEWCREW